MDILCLQRMPFIVRAPLPLKPLYPAAFRSRTLHLTLVCTASVSDSSASGKADAVAEFFLKECGFSEGSLSDVIKRDDRFHSTSLEDARALVEIFKEFGFTAEEIRVIFTRCPYLIRCRAAKALRPKLAFLKSLDLPESVFKNVVSLSPRFLLNRLETMQGVLMTLMEAGIQGKPLLRLLSLRPNILRSNKSTLRSQIRLVKALSIPESSNAYIYGLVAANHSSLQSIESKLRFLESIGLEEDELQSIIRKDPLILIVSQTKMKKVSDFLMHTVGLAPNIIATYPSLLKASIEKRLKPRYLFYVYLQDILPSESLPNLGYFLHASHDQFNRYYLERYPDAVKALERNGYVMTRSGFKINDDLTS